MGPYFCLCCFLYPECPWPGTCTANSYSFLTSRLSCHLFQTMSWVTRLSWVRLWKISMCVPCPCYRTFWNCNHWFSCLTPIPDWNLEANSYLIWAGWYLSLYCSALSLLSALYSWLFGSFHYCFPICGAPGTMLLQLHNSLLPKAHSLIIKERLNIFIHYLPFKKSGK